MCSTGSITPENKGGGIRPLMEDFHKKAAFFCEGFPKVIICTLSYKFHLLFFFINSDIHLYTIMFYCLNI